MSGIKEFFRRLPVFPIFAGLALSWGLIVPSVFELGEKPAARSRHPENELAVFIVLVITAVIVTTSWFLKKPTSSEEQSAEDSGRRLQFGIKGMLIATTLMALILALAPWFGERVAPWMVVVFVAGVVLWATRQDWSVRSRIATLLAILFLPFFWIILYNKPFGYSSGMIPAIPIGPGIILPGLLLRRHISAASGISAAFVVIELLIGAWLARRGGKLWIVYLILVFLFSCFNSLVLHALYRA